MPSSSYDIVVETPDHAAAVEALYADAFGPGRFAKSAERLREGNERIEVASLVAVDAEGLAGVVRLWPVTADGQDGLALLGPLAVAARRRGNGVAFRLMEQAIEAARQRGFSGVVLVGDESYYSRAGFTRAGRDRFRLPGPVNPDRVLIRELTPAASSLKGRLGPPARS